MQGAAMFSLGKMDYFCFVQSNALPKSLRGFKRKTRVIQLLSYRPAVRSPEATEVEARRRVEE